MRSKVSCYSVTKYLEVIGGDNELINFMTPLEIMYDRNCNREASKDWGYQYALTEIEKLIDLREPMSGEELAKLCSGRFKWSKEQTPRILLVSRSEYVKVEEERLPRKRKERVLNIAKNNGTVSVERFCTSLDELPICVEGESITRSQIWTAHNIDWTKADIIALSILQVMKEGAVEFVYRLDDNKKAVRFTGKGEKLLLDISGKELQKAAGYINKEQFGQMLKIFKAKSIAAKQDARISL